MRINTNLDTLELTKTEQATLDKSAALALQIAKHAGGPLQAAGEAAKVALTKLNAMLKGDPPLLEECPVCHQSGEDVGGEYPCAKCGRATVHDHAPAPTKPTDGERKSA